MWNIIKSDEDINELQGCFGNFRNSCVCGLKYHSGAYVGTVSEHFINDDMTVSVYVQRRSMGYVQTYELLFRDIHQLTLEPMHKGMECYLTGASIKLSDKGVTFST